MTTDSLERIVTQNIRMRAFLLALLDPEQYGHAVTEEIRDEARKLLNIPKESFRCTQ